MGASACTNSTIFYRLRYWSSKRLLYQFVGWFVPGCQHYLRTNGPIMECRNLTQCCPNLKHNGYLRLPHYGGLFASINCEGHPPIMEHRNARFCDRRLSTFSSGVHRVSQAGQGRPLLRDLVLHRFARHLRTQVAQRCVQNMARTGRKKWSVSGFITDGMANS